MSKIINLSGPITLHSTSRYPSSDNETRSMGLEGTRNKEIRAMTIAAFRVAQNNDQLSERKMNLQLLLLLLANSTTAFDYRVNKGRLIESTTGVSITPEGLAECQNTLLGNAGAYSTTEKKVTEWVSRILNGDAIASNTREFPAEHWTE